MKHLWSSLLAVSLLSPACVENAPKNRNIVGDYTPPDLTSGPVEEPLLLTDAIGGQDSFELGTWNIESFPKSERTVPSLSSIMSLWRLDFLAIQEIADPAALDELLSRLDGYGGETSEQGKFIRMGYIYKQDEVEILSQEDLFVGNRGPFPRPPLQVKIRIKETGEELTIISVHLKAKGDQASQSRRVLANLQLKAYTDELIAAQPDMKLIILGDFNAGLDRPEMQPWIVSEVYEVATEGLWRQNSFSFFDGIRSLIDHIVTYNVPFQSVKVATSEARLEDMEQNISDHLPVIGVAE